MKQLQGGKKRERERENDYTIVDVPRVLLDVPHLMEHFFRPQISFFDAQHSCWTGEEQCFKNRIL